MLKNKIKQVAADILHQVVEERRYLHSHPELSFCERETSAYVKTKLEEIGVTWEVMAETGVMAIIQGDQPSDKVLALRADMDALPITELNAVDYVSQHPGVMHACGHDVHTSSLLGTARILQLLKSEFGGTIKLIFQPGEEKLPGGAGMMIAHGVLENPRPENVIGQHVMPGIECGKIGLRKGKHMASMDEIMMIVHGKGGHGATPHQNIDPVLISCHIIIALQQIVSRRADPSVPTVLSFGKIIGNGAINVIPNEVFIEGTFRTFDETWREEAHCLIKKMGVTIAESMGANCSIEIVRGYPCLVNDEKLTSIIKSFAEDYLGRANVLDLDIWMAAEDFAYYSQVIPSCFYLLGTGNAGKGIVSSLHTPTFTIDEDALAISTGLMAYIALKRLGN